MVEGMAETPTMRPPAPRMRERATRLTGGIAGNERLTAATGGLLFVLLFLEGTTVPAVRQLLTMHVFVGMLLIPPVALKLASTGYRFARYYTHSADYLRAGPPRLLLRALAPFQVLATLVLFGSGVGMLALGPRQRWVLGVHKASFIVWFFLTAVHVLAYVWRVPRLAAADWGGEKPLGGSLTRRLAVGGALAAGIVLAWVTLPMADPWFGVLEGG
jgi:hypothetical protein